jgi:hypothetical protein
MTIGRSGDKVMGRMPKNFKIDLSQGNLFGLRLDLDQKEAINGGKG